MEKLNLNEKRLEKKRAQIGRHEKQDERKVGDKERRVLRLGGTVGRDRGRGGKAKK